MNETAFNAEYAEAQRTQRFYYGFLCALSVSAISALEEVKGFTNV